jgi:hypothetical protein
LGAGRWDRPEATPFPAPLAASAGPSWPDAVAATTTPVPTPRWLRPAVAALVLLLAGLDLLVTLVELMPADHLVLAPLAGAVVVAAWLAELAGLRWPRLVFAAAIVAPNLVLAAAAHNGRAYKTGGGWRLGGPTTCATGARSTPAPSVVDHTTDGCPLSAS